MKATGPFQPAPETLSRCYLFTGNDPIAIADALARLREAALGEEESPDLDRFDAEEGVTAELMAAAMTPSFFGNRRLVVLRNARRLSAEEAENLAVAILKLPDCACVAIVCDPGDGKAGAEKKLEAAVSKVGEVVRCDASDKNAGLEALLAYAKEREVKLGKPAAAALWALSMQDFVEARAHLDRAIEFSGTTEVTEEDVRACIVEQARADVFRFADAVVERKQADALRELDALFANASKPEDVGYTMVIPQLGRMYRLLWQARALLDEGVKTAAWADQADNPRLPAEHNLAATVKKHSWQADKLCRQAKTHSPASLCEAMLALARADAALKGMGAGVSTQDILGRLVLELCAIGKG